MRYIQRDPETGLVIGHFANEQPYAKELVPDDHPDLLAWEEARKPQPKGKSVETRVAEMEARLATIDVLEARLAILEAKPGVPIDAVAADVKA